jgi:hypothetical protein
VEFLVRRRDIYEAYRPLVRAVDGAEAEVATPRIGETP